MSLRWTVQDYECFLRRIVIMESIRYLYVCHSADKGMSPDNVTSVLPCTHASSKRPRASTSRQAAPFHLPYYYCTTVCSSATTASTCRDRYRSRIENARNSSNQTHNYPALDSISTDCSIARLGRPTPSWPNTASSSWIPTRISSSNSHSSAYLKNSSRRTSKPHSDR